MGLLSVVQVREKDHSGTLRVLKQIKKEIRSKRLEAAKELQDAMEVPDRNRRVYYEGKMADLSGIEGLLDSYILKL